MELIVTVGRRKTSVARVFMKKGTGNIVVNDRPLATYFPIPYYQQAVVKPLTVTEMSNDMDIQVNVQGGGVKGQAEAVRLGISKALCELSAENRPLLKPAGLLTRNPKMVERKKPGQKKARKRFQFSKR
jgi:small subunit ribosomal protein S9